MHAPAGEAARLIDAAREGTRDERERELSAAGGEALGALARGDFVAARARVQAAVERLGSDPELVELGRRIDVREHEKRVADAEGERLARLLAEAEEALAAHDVPGALSKVTEVLARRPDDARARALAARVDELRREEEERMRRAALAEAASIAGVSAPSAAGGGDAGEMPVTLRVRRTGSASLHEAPTQQCAVPEFAAGVAAEAARRPSAGAAFGTTPAAHAGGHPLRLLAFVVLAWRSESAAGCSGRE